MPKILFDDLEQAFKWASASGGFDSCAYISKLTGEVFLTTDGVSTNDAPPDDLHDDSKYLTLPDQHEFDLGTALVFGFVDEFVPDADAEVRALFNRRGAYGRFKDLLARRGLLDQWHAHENCATQAALRGWAADNGLEVVTTQGDTAAP